MRDDEWKSIVKWAGHPRITQPFDGEVMDFLDELSKTLRREKTVRDREDVQAFAFWCRGANLRYLKKCYEQPGREGDGCTDTLRLGRGLVFHIAPANIPMMAAYTMAAGLLAGNSNLVRISQRSLEQNGDFLRILEKLLGENRNEKLRDMVRFISYDSRETDKTAWCSSVCDVRVIWGGDDTVQKIRAFPLKPSAGEVAFPHRYSLSFFREDAVVRLSDDEISLLAHQFCMDTYSMQQNACSSPSTIFWQAGKDQSEGALARKRFWEAVAREAGGYSLQAIHMIRKYTDLCRIAACCPSVRRLHSFGNTLYVVEVERTRMTAEEMLRMQGRFGLFFEVTVETEKELLPYLVPQVQTLTCRKEDADMLRRFIWNHRVRGVDRVVPFGQAMSMELTWDGMNLIERLSREIR